MNTGSLEYKIRTTLLLILLANWQLHMGEHHFNTEEAEKYGIDEAVILYNLRFWLLKNKANKKHEHDGYYWTYNSTRGFAELFTYMSANKIQKILRKLEEKGAIICGNYNKATYDRTKWFTLPEFAIVQIGSVHSAKRLNALSQTAQPIPDINTDRKQDTLQGKLEGSQEKKEKANTDPIPDTPFDSDAWVISLIESPQVHIQLVGAYFLKYAEHDFPTKAVATEELKKNLAPATYLVKNFKQADITKTLLHCQENFSEMNWNLHTVKKQIVHVTKKK